MYTQQENDRFLKLINENTGIIIKICNSYCYNESDRKDLAQEIIFQLWKSNNNFNSDFKFSTWMYRIALNVAISFYRKGKKKLDSITALTEAHINIEDNTADAADTEERGILLQRQIADLEELDRAVILLYFEEKSYKEIAEIIGITETNVGTKVSRIKEKLKQKLNNQKLTGWKI